MAPLQLPRPGRPEPFPRILRVPHVQVADLRAFGRRQPEDAGGGDVEGVAGAGGDGEGFEGGAGAGLGDAGVEGGVDGGSVVGGFGGPAGGGDGWGRLVLLD